MNYAWDANGQNYSDGFKSIEECVENAKGFGCKVGDVIYVGEAKKVQARRLKQTIPFQDQGK